MNDQVLDAQKWQKFAPLVNQYLGVPYKPKAKGLSADEQRKLAKLSHTDRKGNVRKYLVCTSFVDAVLSQYVFEDPGRQIQFLPGGYKKHTPPGRNIFEAYHLKPIRPRVSPSQIENIGLLHNHVYGVAFHMKDEWGKSSPKLRMTVPMPAGSQVHVGFLAYHDGELHLIHSGGKGVHIKKWKDFKVYWYGPNGPKFLKIYDLGAA